MTDIMKMCATCRHKHPYGIVGYSPDNVPLYGARAIGYPTDDPNFTAVCRADQFIEVHGGLENAIALTQQDTEALWAKTSFLGAQVPAATRMAVAQLETLEGKERDKAFMSLMISQVTDIRGAMTREDSKFAHLVAHTDDVVESMRGVTQLSERLSTLIARIDSIEEILVEKRPSRVDAVRRFFMHAFNKLRLRNEAVVTDAEPATDK